MRSQSAGVHVPSSSFGDLSKIFTTFSCNERPLQRASRLVYGYDYWPKFPDNLTDFSARSSTEYSSSGLIISSNIYMVSVSTPAASFRCLSGLCSGSSSLFYGLAVTGSGFIIVEKRTCRFGIEEYTAEDVTLRMSCLIVQVYGYGIRELRPCKPPN